jgi:hypothetical protein
MLRDLVRRAVEIVALNEVFVSIYKSIGFSVINFPLILYLT